MISFDDLFIRRLKDDPVFMSHLELQDFPPLNDPHQNDYDGNNQKDVDETSQGIGSDQPKKPQYDQEHGKGVKHDYYPSLF
jgi:hypothetical protein